MFGHFIIMFFILNKSSTYQLIFLFPNERKFVNVVTNALLWQ